MESMLGSRRRSKKEIPVLHWWFSNIVYLRALQGHSGRNLIDPSLQDNVVIQSWFFQHIYHIGCAFNLHSITNNGLVLGGQNSNKRQTVFLLPVDPRDKEHKDLEKIDVNVPHRSQYLLHAWKKHQDAVYWVNLSTVSVVTVCSCVVLTALYTSCSLHEWHPCWHHIISSLFSVPFVYTPAYTCSHILTNEHDPHHYDVDMVAEPSSRWQLRMKICRNWASLQSTVERRTNGANGASWWRATCPFCLHTFQHCWQVQRIQLRAQTWALRQSEPHSQRMGWQQPRNSSTSWWWTWEDQHWQWSEESQIWTEHWRGERWSRDTRQTQRREYRVSWAQSSMQRPFPQSFTVYEIALDEWQENIRKWESISGDRFNAHKCHHQQDLRCQSGPSAKDSVIFSGGDFSWIMLQTNNDYRFRILILTNSPRQQRSFVGR